MSKIRRPTLPPAAASTDTLRDLTGAPTVGRSGGTSRVVIPVRLLSALVQARHRRCVLVQGSSGSGKTTVLSAWQKELELLGFHVVWLGACSGPEGPLRFLEQLLSSLAHLLPDAVDEARPLLALGEDPEIVERIVIVLVRAIGAVKGEVVLIVDGVELDHDGVTLGVLQWMIDHAPANFHLAIAARSKVHLDLTRLRAKGQLLELDQRDLRFTSAESEAYLIAQLGARGKKEAAQIHELTDGWVAGLQLIAADRRGRRLLNRPLADTGASTSAAPVPDPGAFALYFEREVLLRLEPDKLQLLVNASICDTVSAALCAALSGQPDRTGSAAALLTRMETENLFVERIPYREKETWYRLHPLLRVTLSTMLQCRNFDHRQHLHRLAWPWFRDQGDLEHAIHHAVLAGDGEAAGQLVEQAADRLVPQDQLADAFALLRRLPPDVVQTRFSLRILKVHELLYVRNLDLAARALDGLIADESLATPRERMSIVLLQGMLALQRDDVVAACTILPTLQAFPSHPGTYLQSARDNLMSMLHILRGEPEAARRLQMEALQLPLNDRPLLGTTSGLLQGRCMIGLSHVCEGQMRRAELVYREVLREAEQEGSSCAGPTCFAVGLLGQMLFESDDASGALELLESRVDLLERLSIPDAVLRVMLVLAWSRRLVGDRLEAYNHLERLEDYAHRQKLPRLLGHSLLGQMRLRLEDGSTTEAEELLQRAQAVVATREDILPSTLKKTRLHTARARAWWLKSQGDLEGAAAQVHTVIHQSDAGGWQIMNAQALIQGAVIDRLCGREASALERTIASLRIGHRLGLLRCIVDVDADVRELLDEFLCKGSLDPVLSFYAERLLATREVSSSPLRTPTSVGGLSIHSRLDALSDREMEILNQLAQALPNKKIARALNVSPETVKWHLKSVFGKLGVASRDEAVAKLRDHAWRLADLPASP